MSEIKFPLMLVGIALVIYAGFGFATVGPAGGAIAVFILLLPAVITSVLGVAACFGTAQILGTNFGTLKSASINLAAVAMFPSAAGLLISLISPLLGGIAVIVLFFGLLKSLFDLEVFELIVSVLILGSVMGNATSHWLDPSECLLTR